VIIEDSSDEQTRDRRERLRTSIRDLADEVNSKKARAGGAVGGGVFLLLLSGIAGYDLIRGNLAVWLAIGLSRQTLLLFGVALALTGFLLFALGLLKLRPAARRSEERLAALECEYDSNEDRD
jgi:hypothetical protein